MDWQTIITVGVVLLFIAVMMRGCGGMMRGAGCGSSAKGSSCGTPKESTTQERKSAGEE